MPQGFRLNILKQLNQSVWRGGNEGWLVALRGDTSMWFYLATIAWSAIFTLPPFICETPSLPPTKYAS
jgi:hypothetical protein